MNKKYDEKEIINAKYKGIMAWKMIALLTVSFNATVKAIPYTGNPTNGMSTTRGKFNQISISGTVSNNNERLSGVSIKVKRTNQATRTDHNGAFKISVPDGNVVLVFSMVGYESQEVSIAGKSQIDVVLKCGFSQLDEVVVVGFGTQKRGRALLL